MRPLLSAVALWILLTPALAQQVEESNDQPQQATEAAIQPASEATGLTQADALAAARADAQDEEQYPMAPPPAEEALGVRQPGAQQSDIQQPEAEQAAQPAGQAPSPYEAQPAEQQEAEQAPGAQQPEASQVGAAQQAAQSAEQQAPPPYEAQPAGAMPPNVAMPPQDDSQPYEPPSTQRRALEVPAAIRPRPEAAAYPVYREQQQFSVGARLLSAKEVERRFSTPLGKQYLVVEVGVFPADAQTIMLRPDDFTLRIGNDDQAFFPATPGDVASALSSNSGPRHGGVYPSLGVGYGGGRWGHGVSTGVGVGVGNGPYYPRRGGMAGANRRVMEDELRDKSLHEGRLTQPVAGYLYFPLTEKHATHYHLEFNRNGETLSLPLPLPAN